MGVRQKYNMESRTETMRLLAGDTSRSLTSEYSSMKKNRGHAFAGIPWLYIIGANSVLVNIILAWVFMNVPDTAYNGIDHHRTLAGGSTTQVGFMILGANRLVLAQSMDQRIKQAFDKFVETCNKPGYQGVFFPTGNNHHDINPPEAAYIADEIRRLYKELKVRGARIGAYQHLKKPIIEEEGGAKFTVDNFLKTIPKVAEYQKNNGDFKVVYMVTNEYHMGRSDAILGQFKDCCLVDFCVENCEVPRRIQSNDRDEWLDSDAGGQTREQKIRNDTSRDITNSGCFSRSIFTKQHDFLFKDKRSLIEAAYKCDQYKYTKANLWKGWGQHEDCADKIEGFKTLVGEFKDLYAESHTCTGDCRRVANKIRASENKILRNLRALQAEKHA